MSGHGRPNHWFYFHDRLWQRSFVWVLLCLHGLVGSTALLSAPLKWQEAVFRPSERAAYPSRLPPISDVRGPVQNSASRFPWEEIDGARPLSSAANPADSGRAQAGAAGIASELPTSQPVRLRFTLGGTRPIPWEGLVRVKGPEEGVWRDLRLLSIEPTAIGSVRLSPDHSGVVLAHPDSLEYSCFQVDCIAGTDSQLEIHLRSPTQPHLSFYQLVELGQVIAGPWNLSLGNSGNGLWIERPAEDQIRFMTSATSDLLQVGHSFDLTFQPNRLKVPRGSTIRYVLQLSELSSGQRLIREEKGELKQTPDGDFLPPPAWPILVGPTPGVYQVQVDLHAAKTGFSLIPGVNQTATLVATRKLQWVAMDPQRSTPPTATVHLASATLTTSDARPRELTERLRIEPPDLNNGGPRVLELPRMPWLSRWNSHARPPSGGWSTRGSEVLHVAEQHGRSTWELGPNQWRTIELPAMDPGNYLIDIEWLETDDVHLGLDVAHPDRWGRVSHWTASSQLSRTPNPLLPASSPVEAGPGWQQWRTLHWFNGEKGHKPSQIVLSNSSPTHAIALGSIRISSIDSSPETTVQRLAPGRGVGVFLETPLLASLFSGRKVSESAEAPPLNDWLSYYDAAQRLGQFLSNKHYNTVWLPVYKQGGSLFPTAPFASTPRFENSVFGPLGQSTERMDVLTLLLHTLSQTHLSLIPVLDFSTPVQLEGVSDPIPANPLDPAFQDQVLQFVTMVARRSQHHAAFAGMAIELSPDSLLLFASDSAGISPPVVARFLADQSLEWPTTELGPMADASPESLGQWVLRHHRSLWLTWRAAELTNFFERMQKELAAATMDGPHPHTPLYLVLTHLHRQPMIEHTLYPSLRSRPNWQQNWLRIGLDVSRFNHPEAPRIVIQQAASRGVDLAANRRVQEAVTTPEFWHSLSSLSYLGKLSQRNTQRVSLEALHDYPTDHPGQRPQTFQVVESQQGHESLWAETLRRHDCRQLLSQAGGLPRTLHAAEQAFSQAFSRLWDQPFETLYQDPSSPATLRQSAMKQDSNETQWYLVNAAAWPITCRIQLDAAAPEPMIWQDLLTGGVLQASSGEEGDNRLRPARGPATLVGPQYLVIQAPPHSLLVFGGPRLTAASVTITEAPAEGYERLQAVKDSLFRRLRQVAANAVPLTSIVNPSFEQPVERNPSARIPNWTHGPLDAGQALDLDPSAFQEGSHSLKMTNAGGILWLRSNPLAPPTTGRLSVTAWIKNSSERPAESIRLAVDGQSNSGAKYYRFAEIPLGPAGPAASSAENDSGGWQPVAVHFDDLPEEDLVSLRIGFDLMHPGQIWVDSIQCFDRWLDANDQKVLSNRLGLAAFSLENKRHSYAAYQALDDYWLRFLLTHVPDPNSPPELSRSTSDIPATDGRLKNARGRRFLPLR